MTETVLEFVKRQLDSELQSEDLNHLPPDFYMRVSQYSQKLRRSAGSGSSEAAIRMIARQTEMIRSMVAQIFEARSRKSAKGQLFFQLLPEERYVCTAQRSFRLREEALLEALSEGQPSFVEFANRKELSRNTTVRFVKRINELVGTDLKRYGPFEENDVASLPAANADILIAEGDAIEVNTREES